MAPVTYSLSAITSAGAKSSFSNYGAATVDIGAPGSGIYSTLPGKSNRSAYGSYSGTSMATPHVTGAVALYAAALVSGIVVVELVFSYPGVGQELVRSVSRREVHVVQAIALLSATAVVFFNLVADLAILALDPRTRRA